MRRLPSLLLRTLGILLLGVTAFSAAAQKTPATIQQNVGESFRFVVYGDTRFTDPSNSEAANPLARRALVDQIARVHPAFIAMTGDIVYRGDDKNDWKVFSQETGSWSVAHIPVYPTIGNHELKADAGAGLANYFATFSALKQSRYYSVTAGNTVLVFLDSNIDEVSGEEGAWLDHVLGDVPHSAEFVVLVLHHPPNTSATEDKDFGGGHSVRMREKALARYLEEKQKTAKQRFVVISGHVHNYDRHERNGIVYLVSGGGGAHAYAIHREPEDPFQSDSINYHYLVLDSSPLSLRITMHRLEILNGGAVWTEPDSIVIAPPRH